MKTAHRSLAFLLLPLALACSERGPASAPPNGGAASGGRASALETERPAAHFELQCSGHRFSLVGDRDAAVIERNHGSRPQTLPKPEGMADYVPVGMGCARSTRGGEYLVVEYGEPLIGCNICEWFFVYDADGIPLNQSQPAMLGSAGSLYPNNEGYTQVSKQLDLHQPKIQHAPRPRPLDVEGPSLRGQGDNASATEPN